VSLKPVRDAGGRHAEVSLAAAWLTMHINQRLSLRVVGPDGGSSMDIFRAVPSRAQCVTDWPLSANHPPRSGSGRGHPVSLQQARRYSSFLSHTRSVNRSPGTALPWENKAGATDPVNTAPRFTRAPKASDILRWLFIIGAALLFTSPNLKKHTCFGNIPQK